jgi:phage shock protein C
MIIDKEVIVSSEPERLCRARTDRWLGGVCGGIGHYFNLDPTLIRVLFVLFALAFGGGFLAYVILWLIIPLEPATLEESAGAVVEEE